MRVTKYVKSDGENWMMLKLRCSAQVSYDRLDKVMRANGWIHWSTVKDKFDALKKRLARQDSVKYPNWKAVVIPMVKAGIKDLPTEIRAENEAKTIQIEGASNEESYAESVAAGTVGSDAPAEAQTEEKKNSLAAFAKTLGVQHGN